tara:strand:- start:5938 stop:6243 length:306 start_codon:yes stop_codon:yes gene_type:complete
MEKLLNLVKNSFTLFETLLSITILIIIISGFSNSTYYDEKAINNSKILNDLENKFTINDFNSFSTSNIKITITKNHNQKEEILVKKHSFENDELKIFKYEK